MENKIQSAPPIASHDLLVVLVALPEDERNTAYVDANSYRWPSSLLGFMPEKWDEMDNRERFAHPSAKVLWTAIHQCTSEFGRSQAWWVIELGRTREDHAAWWNNVKEYGEQAGLTAALEAYRQNN